MVEVVETCGGASEKEDGMSKRVRFTPAQLERIRNRKGAQRRSEIPGEVIEALNHGLVPTANLVEWLAIDAATLLENVLNELDLGVIRKAALAEFAAVAELGVNRRTEAIGRILHEVAARPIARRHLFDGLSRHPADVVRNWASYMLWADAELDLADRLDKTRLFAADPHFGVRESAWMTFRPFLINELDRGLMLLKPWVVDSDPNVRRCAVEATRPRGVWCAHIAPLKDEPHKALHLLEPVRSDPSRYVQLSAGNWLNDASKSQPEWTMELCRRWEIESPTPATAKIVRRGLRTLHKSR